MDSKHRTHAPTPTPYPGRPAAAAPPDPDEIIEDETLRLPHERDEAPAREDAGAVRARQGPRQVIEQAASDIAHGLRDTERRGIPSDVPSPGRKRARQRDPMARSAEVPPEGVSRTSYGKAQKPPSGHDEEK